MGRVVSNSPVDLDRTKLDAVSATGIQRPLQQRVKGPSEARVVVEVATDREMAISRPHSVAVLRQAEFVLHWQPQMLRWATSEAGAQKSVWSAGRRQPGTAVLSVALFPLIDVRHGPSLLRDVPVRFTM